MFVLTLHNSKFNFFRQKFDSNIQFKKSITIQPRCLKKDGFTALRAQHFKNKTCTNVDIQRNKDWKRK